MKWVNSLQVALSSVHITLCRRDRGKCGKGWRNISVILKILNQQLWGSLRNGRVTCQSDKSDLLEGRLLGDSLSYRSWVRGSTGHDYTQAHVAPAANRTLAYRSLQEHSFYTLSVLYSPVCKASALAWEHSQDSPPKHLSPITPGGDQHWKALQTKTFIFFLWPWTFQEFLLEVSMSEPD